MCEADDGGRLFAAGEYDGQKNAAMQSIRGVCNLRLFIVLVDIIFVFVVVFVVLAFVEKRIISVIS